MKKPFDFSVKPPPSRSPIPNFRRIQYATGTVTGTAAGAVLSLLSPNTMVSIHWIELQLQGAATIQLQISGQGISAVYTLNQNAICRFPSTWLMNSEILQLVITGAVSVTYSVAYTAGICDPYYVDVAISNPSSQSSSGHSNSNIFDSTGNVITADTTAPSGTESALVTRDLFRKVSTLLTTTPLGANGVYTSAWFDTNLTGTTYLTATAVSNVASLATSGLQIQESEDQVNVRNIGGAGAATTTQGDGYVRKRYWRIVYTNASTAQTTFSLYVTEVCIPFTGNSIANNGTVESVNIAAGASATGPADSLSSASFSQILTSGGTGGLQSIAQWLFNGGTYDRQRNNAAVTTGDTGAKTASFNGATQTNFDSLGAWITAIISAVSGTTPTLTMQLQFSPDGGTTWLNLGPVTATLTAAGTILIACFPTNFSQTPGATPANLTVGATVSTLINAPLPRTWRIVYTITGTTPSFTIGSVQVNYQRG